MTGGEAEYLTVGVVALPLALSMAAFVFGRPIGAAAGFVAAAGLAWAALQLARRVLREGGWQYALGGWAAPLGIQMRIDGLSVLMLVMTAAVGAATTVYAQGYFAKSKETEAALFWPLYLLLWGALNGMFLSSDIFNLYILLELVTLASVALVALDGSAAALTAALRYLLLAMLGSLAYLLGVALLYSEYSALDMATLARAVEPGSIAYAATGLMTVGLIVKAALPPLHIWLPPAHASAPAPVSALLSALVVKAPYYLILRLWFEVFAGSISIGAAHVLGGLGAIAIFWGAYHALRVPRLKQVIAYSTISQIGYLFLLFPLAQDPGARVLAFHGGVFFSLAHALTKAALFLAAGTIQKRTGHDRLKDLTGTGERMPVTFSAYGLAVVSLIGLPPAGLFAAKWMLLSAAVATGQWWYALVVVAGGPLTAAYLVRFAYYALCRSETVSPETGPSWSLDLPTMAISLAALLLGLAANTVVQIMESGGPFI